MEQIDLLSQPVGAAPPLDPTLLLSMPIAAVPVARANSPWSVNDCVRHTNPAVTWEGTIVGTPATHPWDCCAEMVLVAVGERVERMPIDLLRLVE